MSHPKSRSVLVAGGGITGLATALCLARSGLRVDVFEQAEGFETIGAGLQISPNAFHVLSMLGVTDRLKDVATGPLSIRVMSARRGREILSIPLGATAIKRYGAPYLVAHRADLHQVLAGAVHDHPDISLHLNSRLEDFSIHPRGVTALVYENGELSEHTSKALVAADGVWSNLRSRCFDATPAVFSGLIAWRCLITAEQLPGSVDMENTQLWLAPDAHAVTYPVRGGRYLNVVVVTRPTEEETGTGRKWASTAYASEIKALLPDWCDEFVDLLRYRTRWTRWPLFHSPQRAKWTRGPAALAGDAAHAMLPFAAQGAAMGIEDAAALGECLASARISDDYEGAMQLYERVRASRVRKVARMGRTNRLIYHLNRPFSIARNLGMLALGGERLLARQDWIYGWRPVPSPDDADAKGVASAPAE